jgi:hypothetical protein
MPVLPSFRLRNLLQVLPLPHVSSSEPTSSHSTGSTRAVPPKPDAGYIPRCLAWAEASGRSQSKAYFATRLDGRQVSAELFEQFRLTPEFGRELTERLESFHDNDSLGNLTLIDAGGEASVFFDSGTQRVIKLFAPPNEGRFGWVLDRTANGRWGIRGGSLVEALFRFAWFEACFVSGLELDTFGRDADFLTLSQPFYVGRRPCEDELEDVDDGLWRNRGHRRQIKLRFLCTHGGVKTMLLPMCYREMPSLVRQIKNCAPLTLSLHSWASLCLCL